MKDYLKTLKESGAITEFAEYAINEKVEQIISERDKEFIEILEDNRKETMWANKEDQEVSDQGIDDFIEAVKLKLQTLNK